MNTERTVTTAAKQLKLTPARIRVFIKSGRLKAERCPHSGIWLINQRELDAFKKLKRHHGKHISSPEKSQK